MMICTILRKCNLLYTKTENLLHAATDVVMILMRNLTSGSFDNIFSFDHLIYRLTIYDFNYQWKQAIRLVEDILLMNSKIFISISS